MKSQSLSVTVEFIDPFTNEKTIETIVYESIEQYNQSEQFSTDCANEYAQEDYAQAGELDQFEPEVFIPYTNWSDVIRYMQRVNRVMGRFYNQPTFYTWSLQYGVETNAI